MSEENKEVVISGPEHALEILPERGLYEFKRIDGYGVRVEEGAIGEVKLAKDGKTRLIPQPSDDLNDPLNWTWRTKNLILATVAFAALLPDYGSATGAVTLLPQAKYGHPDQATE